MFCYFVENTHLLFQKLFFNKCFHSLSFHISRRRYVFHPIMMCFLSNCDCLQRIIGKKNINNCCKPYFSFFSHIQHDDAFLMEYNRYESRTLSWYLGHYLMSCSCYLIFCLRILALAYVISLESIQPATSPWHSKSNCFQFLVGWHHFLLHIRYTCWYVLQWE